MIRRLTLLVVVAGMLVGSAAFAADTWNGLTVGNSYTLTISEPYSYTGTIQQFKSLDSLGAGVGNVAVVGGVAFSLPSISVLTVNNPTGGATNNPFWGVCIDTHEWSTSPEGATLKQGWTAAPNTLGMPARANGTVIDEVAWNHTTYLFNQSNITNMTVAERAAFQLATWEVLSGDGDANGGNWATGLFRASANAGILNIANGYVKTAYNTGFAGWTGSKAMYFSGAFQSGGNVAYQDYLVYAPAASGNGTPAVPEIPAAALCPLGLMAFGMLRRRFAK